MPTPTTIPLILLLIYMWHKTSGRILPAVVLTSVFSAASAINIGSLGISCWLFTLFTFGTVRLLQGHRPFRVTPGYNRAAVYALVAFILYAAISGILFPTLFAGTMVARVSTPEPLSWGMSNFAQLCYLVAAAVLYLIAISSSRKELEEALEWYVRGCVLAAVIAFYQLLNAVTHIPYPNSVLYSNKSYVIFPAYQINGLWRLNSTFTEASDMAGFMIVGIALLGWTIVTRRLSTGRFFCLALMLASLVMTQSSVGYATLLLLLITGGLLYVGHLFRGGTMTHGKLVVAISIVAVLAAVCWFNDSALSTARHVFDTTLVQKQDSVSYRARSLTHVTAFQALKDTYYLGAGWGSIRPSGLLYVLLGNTGVLGVLLFVLFIGSLFLPLFRNAQVSYFQSEVPINGDLGSPLPRSLFAMMMLLTTMVMAGSEIGDPILWVLFGMATLGREPYAMLNGWDRGTFAGASRHSFDIEQLVL